jgi:hypothetical protein
MQGPPLYSHTFFLYFMSVGSQNSSLRLRDCVVFLPYSEQRFRNFFEERLRFKVPVYSAKYLTSPSACFCNLLATMTRRTMGPNLALFRTTRIFARCRNPVEDTCPICLEHYSADHRAVRVRLRGCMHTYGRQCIDGWLLSASPNRNTCPTCRIEWYTLDSEKEEVRPAPNPSRLLVSLRHGSDRIRRSLAAKIEPRRDPADVITGIRVPAPREFESETDEHTLDEISRLLSILEGRFEGIAVPGISEEPLRHLELRIRLLRRDNQGQDTQGNEPSVANVNYEMRGIPWDLRDGEGLGLYFGRPSPVSRVFL